MGRPRDRLSPRALFGGLNPGGLAGGGWLIPPPGSSGILKASRKGMRLFSPGMGAGFLPFPKGGVGTWVCLIQASPLGRECKDGLKALFEVEQVQVLPDTEQKLGLSSL